MFGDLGRRPPTDPRNCRLLESASIGLRQEPTCSAESRVFLQFEAPKQQFCPLLGSSIETRAGHPGGANFLRSTALPWRRNICSDHDFFPPASYSHRLNVSQPQNSNQNSCSSLDYQRQMPANFSARKLPTNKTQNQSVRRSNHA